MTQQLADPSFVSTIDDTVATVDVYETSAEKPINSIKDDVTPTTGSPGGLSSTIDDIKNSEWAGSMIRGGKNLLSAAPFLVSSASKVIDATAPGMKGISKGLGLGEVGTDILKKLSPGLADTLMSGVGKYSATISAVIGTATRIIPGSKNIKDLKLITDGINNITGSDVASVVSGGGLIGRGIGMVNSAVSLGLPGSFGALTKASSMGDKIKILNGSMPNIVKAGDVFGIKDALSGLGSGIADKTKGFSFGSFLESYTKPIATKASDVASEFGLLKSTLTATDPSWNLCHKDQVSSFTDSFWGKATENNFTSVFPTLDASGDFADIYSAGALVSDDSVDKDMLVGTALGKSPDKSMFKDVFKGISKHFPGAQDDGSGFTSKTIELKATQISENVTSFSPAATVSSLYGDTSNSLGSMLMNSPQPSFSLY